MQNKDDQSQGSNYQPVNRQWPDKMTISPDKLSVGWSTWLFGNSNWKWFLKKANKKRKKERKKILCLSHFIILKLSKIVNAKMVKITGEQFFFEMFPILQCKECLWIQGNVFVFYWILLYNNYQYFLYYFDWSQMSHELIFVIRNEPWLS